LYKVYIKRRDGDDARVFLLYAIGSSARETFDRVQEYVKDAFHVLDITLVGEELAYGVYRLSGSEVKV